MARKIAAAYGVLLTAALSAGSLATPPIKFLSYDGGVSGLGVGKVINSNGNGTLCDFMFCDIRDINGTMTPAQASVFFADSDLVEGDRCDGLLDFEARISASGVVDEAEGEFQIGVGATCIAQANGSSLYRLTPNTSVMVDGSVRVEFETNQWISVNPIPSGSGIASSFGVSTAASESSHSLRYMSGASPNGNLIYRVDAGDGSSGGVLAPGTPFLPPGRYLFEWQIIRRNVGEGSGRRCGWSESTGFSWNFQLLDEAPVGTTNTDINGDQSCDVNDLFAWLGDLVDTDGDAFADVDPYGSDASAILACIGDVGPDCNGNGFPDEYDVHVPVEFGGEADINQDGVPDSCQLIDACPADANLSGAVDVEDITLVVSNLGLGYADASGTPGDADGDGLTTVADVTFIVSNLGCTWQ
ncbi:MAG: hypothetical protein AAGD00_03810 [Planctomycetota bacterium]